MRDFQGKSTLRRLDPGGRLVYTCFLVFAAAGLCTAALLHTDGMGTGVASATAYWRGDDVGVVYPKSYRQVLELTHFHLFTEPVLFLVVAHLYNLGSDTLRRRTVATAATVVAMACQVALPWLVSFVAAGFGLALIPVHTTLLLGLLYMIGWSLREMWTP